MLLGGEGIEARRKRFMWFWEVSLRWELIWAWNCSVLVNKLPSHDHVLLNLLKCCFQYINCDDSDRLTNLAWKWTCTSKPWQVDTCKQFRKSNTYIVFNNPECLSPQLSQGLRSWLLTCAPRWQANLWPNWQKLGVSVTFSCHYRNFVQIHNNYRSWSSSVQRRSPRLRPGQH